VRSDNSASHSPATARKTLPAAARPWLALAAGAAAAFPLAACQPKPNPAPSSPTTVSTTVTTDPASGEKVREVVREKIVYVDRPASNTPAPAPPADPVIATVDGTVVRMSDLRQPLLESYGLGMALNVMQLKLAQAEAQRRNVSVTDADVKKETDETLAQMFPEAKPADYPTMLTQLLTQQRLTRAEFDILMRVNATLRAIAATLVEREPKEETLREAFNVFYGETVRVRHIACSNLQEITEAQKRLAAGVPFDAVARELSRNPRTAPLGGELPAFSRASADVAPVFKDAAFALKEGEVSDPVQAEGYYHLIKLERRIPPKATKYEDVRESIKAQLYARALDGAIKQFRQSLGDQARQVIKFEDPVLAAQWQERLNAAQRPPAR
jgi:parvulin-like peptidyl-prolyl isomerase